MDKKLQEIAKNLLAKVDIIIGYEKGYDEFQARPVFINNPEDVNKLIINKYCTNNLAVYLPTYRKIKIGIVAKGCDIRSIRELIKEHQIPKENVIIIGVICEGVVDKKGTLAQRCDYCQEKSPKDIDILVGEVKEFSAKSEDYNAVEDFEKLSSKEREEFWNKEFERCIRCYACRQVCPVCYCPDCFTQRNMPEYLNPKVSKEENKLFQMVRMQHVFGRCTDCRSCENACPVGIPLSLITQKITKDALELFGYVSGADEESKPPLSTFKKDEILEEIM
ncbi:MAG: 4Fe-4S dicluster domain-containing protein [Nitrospirota bacterium]